MLGYRLLYRVGITPWDHGKVPAELVAVVEGDSALPPGRALDIGCGTGTQAVYLFEHGWQVSGVDAVERALAEARQRGQQAGAEIQWLNGDVAQLGSLGLEPGFSLMFDRGCYHGLPIEARRGYAQGVTKLAAPGCVLLLMAFAPGRRVLGPSGASLEEVERHLGPDWSLESAVADSGPAPPGPLARVPRTWYRFRRRA